MRSGTLPIRLAFGFLTLLFTSCATMTKDDLEIVNRAKTIHRYPVSRDKFIRTLGLEKIPSQRRLAGARCGRYSYLETWVLTGGGLVHAWDSDRVEMKPETIDQIIGPRRPPYDAFLNRGPAPSPMGFLDQPPRDSFESCVITSPRGKVFFDSSSYIHSLGKSS